MDFLALTAYRFDPVGTIKKRIEKWSPRKCVTEKDYERSLLKYLNSEFDDPSIEIVPQSAVGRSKADIRIGKHAIIELKLNLKDKASFDRLRGQIEEYSKWEGRTIIVLIGDTDPQFRKRLLQDSRGTLFDFEHRLIVIEK